MIFVDDFPERVEIHDHVVIPMADGVELSARIWLPDCARDAPVPAILEYIPYRKRFGSASRDELTHGYLSGHGYACVRVDIRGSGESEGVLTDEYLQSELEDGLAIIDWIAAQDWCDGNVGMMGISWGGFNALQLAALQPGPLKAIMAASASDDRFADDVHHMGGCVLGDNLSWASVMFAYNSMPPDPELVGPKWREMWFERLERSGFWLDKWLRHQRRDDYWKHGSVCEDYSAIRIPVMAVSGWADGYTNAVFRLLRNLDCPRRGLVGPWAHTYPHLGKPGPAIHFLEELVRWWDHWLKGEENGVMDEPMLLAWMQDSEPPQSSYAEREGHWVAEEHWPSDRVKSRRFSLTRGRLLDPQDCDHSCEPDSLSIQSPLSTGLFAGKWCAYASGPDLAHDQRQEDGGALVFETEPLEEAIQVLGAAELTLEVSVDKPIAMVAARLSDVRPDGSATRFTYGLLNLSHRESREHPEPMVPGERQAVTFRLNHIGQMIPAGHRLRLSLSTSYWPLAWPSPEPVCLTVHLAGSRLDLPVRHAAHVGHERPKFGDPQIARPEPKLMRTPEEHDWIVHRHLARDSSVLEVINDQGVYAHEYPGLEVGAHAREWYRSVGNDHASVEGETRWTRSLSREGWNIRTETRTLMRSDSVNFYLEGDLDAYEDGDRVFCRTWSRTIPRDLA
ncbi:CocE/NonD family hydrolase [Erythrobacter sp.]|uniref:CocE/NonD family hydrolase n=1 Tax=Erythrobacter sp. TaxID=1042 RepID=UPI001425E884|nr:CocE/NonD family hydrolase [Erythrobacter sp.]QIQ85376.1 MAG: CocE/NonD family hydrolase [Erythrobacter sp.]